VEPDGPLSVLFYNNQHSHRLQLHITHPASAFSIRGLPNLKEKIRLHINTIITEQPQRQRFALSGRHYVSVARYLMEKCLFWHLSVWWVLAIMPIFQSLVNQHLHFRPCQNADVFNSLDEDAQQKYSEVLSALLCIAHVLPLVQKSSKLLQKIFRFDDGSSYEPDDSFHTQWTLDGWNDHIIQPARDAVLEYYKVRSKTRFLQWLLIQWSIYQRHATKSMVEVYMRISNIGDAQSSAQPWQCHTCHAHLSATFLEITEYLGL